MFALGPAYITLSPSPQEAVSPRQSLKLAFLVSEITRGGRVYTDEL